MNFKFLFPILIFCSQAVMAQVESQPASTLAEQEISEALNLASEVSGKTAEADKQTVDSAVSAEKIAEDQIALNLEAKKTAHSKEGSALNMILGFSIFGILISGGYFLVRKYSIPKPSRHQTQIKVLQQHYLGPKKSLAIVRVAGESILLGITDHSISHLRTLTLLDDEIPNETSEMFDGVLKGMSGNASFEESDDDADQFALSGIRDVVSTKLKGMRSFE